MPFSPIRYRAALSGLLMATSFTVPATSAVSLHQQRFDTSSSNLHCGTTSPYLLAMGDDYYNLDTPLQDSQDIDVPQQLSYDELLAALQSKHYHSGKGQRTECFGVGDKLHPRSSSIILQDIASKAESGSYTEQDHDPVQNIVFQAYESNEQQHLSRHESLVIPLSATAIETFSGLLISSHQRKRQITPTGSYLRETQLTALQTEYELILEESQFVNGTLAQWTTWQLDREVH